LLDSDDTDEILVDKLPLRPLTLALALALAEVDNDTADLVTVLAVALVSEFFRTEAGLIRDDLRLGFDAGMGSDDDDADADADADGDVDANAGVVVGGAWERRRDMRCWDRRWWYACSDGGTGDFPI
jgi:hypothetical protein